MALNEANSLVLARLALEHFGFDPETTRLTFVKMRENIVFRADTASGPIALRLHRPGYRSREEVEAESEFIGVLAERGFPVVQLVPTMAGSYTAVVSDGDTEVIVDAQRWLEDSRMLGNAENPELGLEPSQFELMGQIAAKMHRVAAELSGNRTFARANWDAEGLVGENALWGDALNAAGLDETAKAQLVRTRALMLSALAKFGSSAEVYGTIHADFTPENLLVSGEELVVIDFDDFGDGWYLFDLATALFFYLEVPNYEECREALLRGYRSERALSEDEEAWLDLFLVARGYTYLGWAGTRSETETAEFLVAEIVPLVVRLAAQLEVRLTALV